MTHIEFLTTSELVKIHAIRGNAVYFTDLCSGEGYAEINGGTWPCSSIEEFEELVEFFGEDDFSD